MRRRAALALLSAAAGCDATYLIGRGEAQVAIAFDPPTSVDVGRGPMALVAADFDRDRRVDLAVADTSGGEVTILFGAGDGTFPRQASYPASVDPTALAAADLDGDGALDLVVASGTAGQVTLLHGRPDGTFAPWGRAATGQGPHAVAIADLDRDGKLDVVTADWFGGTLSALHGRGDGSFDEPASSPVGLHPWSLALVDLDGDGALDAVTADSGAGTVTLLLGAPRTTARFAAAGAFTVGAYPFAVAALDRRGGGATLAVALRGEDHAALLAPSGADPRALAVAARLPTGGQPTSLAVADLDGDGRADLAVSDATGGCVTVLRGDGSGGAGVVGRFGAPLPGPFGIVAADLDGDGRPDLAVANPVSPAGDELRVVSILLNRSVPRP